MHNSEIRTSSRAGTGSSDADSLGVTHIQNGGVGQASRTSVLDAGLTTPFWMLAQRTDVVPPGPKSNFARHRQSLS